MKNCKNARKFKASLLQLSAFTMIMHQCLASMFSSHLGSWRSQALLTPLPYQHATGKFWFVLQCLLTARWTLLKRAVRCWVMQHRLKKHSVLLYRHLLFWRFSPFAGEHAQKTCSLTWAETLICSQVLKQPQGWPGNSLAFCTYTTGELCYSIVFFIFVQRSKHWIPCQHLRFQNIFPHARTSELMASTSQPSPSVSLWQCGCSAFSVAMHKEILET